MNKLSKFFLFIIVLLVIFLLIVLALYFNMRKVAKLNYILYQHATEQVKELKAENNLNNYIE